MPRKSEWDGWDDDSDEDVPDAPAPRTVAAAPAVSALVRAPKVDGGQELDYQDGKLGCDCGSLCRHNDKYLRKASPRGHGGHFLRSYNCGSNEWLSKKCFNENGDYSWVL